MITLLSIILTFFGTTLFGYIAHKLLHHKVTMGANKAHMTHHLVKYPKEDYLSDVYRYAGKDSSDKPFILASIPFLALIVYLCVIGVLPIVLTIVVLIEIFFIGWLHDYIHDAFHIRDHWLERTFLKSQFLKLRDVHYVHHVDMSKNFGIFFFLWDKVFKSFKRE